MPRDLIDAKLQVTKALPNGAATSTTDGIDLDITSNADFQAPMELVIDAPALDSTALPNTKTIKYSVYHDSASDFSSEALLAGDVVVQTGAGGDGDDAATGRLPLPTNVSRYIRVKAVGSASGDASGSSVTVSLAH